MDEDVKELIGNLADEMRRGFGKVDARFDQMETRFEQIDSRFEQVDGRSERIEGRIDTVESKLDAKIDTKVEDAKRYFGVLAEDLYGSIRASAEADAAAKRVNDERYEYLVSEISEIKSMIPISFTQLDGRIRSLETDNADLQSRVERLESGTH